MKEYHVVELKKLWRDVLRDKDITETSAAETLGLYQSDINRRINTGSLKVVDLMEYLDVLGYRLEIVRKDNEEDILFQAMLKSKEGQKAILEMLRQK